MEDVEKSLACKAYKSTALRQSLHLGELKKTQPPQREQKERDTYNCI